MDVLYTTAGEVVTELTALGVFVGILLFVGGVAMIGGLIAEKGTPILTGILAILIAFALTCTLDVRHETGHKPDRYDVTLREGYVIDATKYEIVEQRGKIYVIEEREAAE